jgi:hypothetical protein
MVRVVRRQSNYAIEKMFAGIWKMYLGRGVELELRTETVSIQRICAIVLRPCKISRGPESIDQSVPERNIYEVAIGLKVMTSMIRSTCGIIRYADPFSLI